MRKSGWVAVLAMLGGASVPVSAEDTAVERPSTVPVTAVENIPPMMPSYQAPAREWETLDEAMPDQREQCRAVIAEMREERNLLPPEHDDTRAADDRPLFDRKPAIPEEGLLVAAVDQQVDGCSVLVMARNKSDWRPVPQPQQQRIRIIPAE
ncbi:MAG: hypothetical protein WA954_02275 [Parerythrobacter sp.]